MSNDFPSPRVGGVGNDVEDNGTKNYDVLPHFTEENYFQGRFKSIARQKKLRKKIP
jgi:peptide subunit release factor RF-3